MSRGVDQSSTFERTAEAIVLGGGLCGIGAAIRLLRDTDVEDVVVLERAEQLGGTWLHNTYPGCACDIPSALYSFEFAPNPEWPRMYARGPEILAYLQRVADDYASPQRTVFGTEVLDASWDDDAQLWRLETTSGRYAAPIFIFAPGPLHEPSIPDVPGRERFAGHEFHSSAWDHDYDLADKRVAVIGTGPSAIQFVPEIQPLVDHMVVLQRTPGWVIPKTDWETSRLERSIYRRSRAAMTFARGGQWLMFEAVLRLWRNERLTRRLIHPLCRAFLRRTVHDEQLRAALTPDWTFGCKRMLVSNTWYPALGQPNVELVPHAIREVRERSIVAADGSEHEVDTIIWATGFHVTDLPFTERMRGIDGRTLAQAWDGRPSAFMGAHVSGFPNAFMLFGPNVGTGSAFVMLEAQLNYVCTAVRVMRERELASIDIRAEVVRAFKQEMNERFEGSTWTAGGCASYYQDAAGDNASIYPGSMRGLVRRGQEFELANYSARRAHTAVPTPTRNEVRA